MNSGNSNSTRIHASHFLDYRTTLVPIHGMSHSRRNNSLTVVNIEEMYPGFKLSTTVVPDILAAASVKPATVVFASADTT
jgi:hypothetical protein